jgi:prepilin-type processing-associated H-X9-DG protein
LHQRPGLLHLPPNGLYGTDGTGQVYSFHSGGVNVVLGDGSLRFVNQGISVTTLAALVTRAGGDVIGSDF